MLGHVWPSAIVNVMFGRLSVVDPLLFRRAPGSGPSVYTVVAANGEQTGVVVYSSPAPFSGEIGAIAHEVCHAQQDAVARDAGGRPGATSDYYDTEEGRDFIEVTGWRQQDGVWVEKCEPWSCGYPSPLEDSAELCATYYDPGRFNEPDHLERFAPKRCAWARRWLPK